MSSMIRYVVGHARATRQLDNKVVKQNNGKDHARYRNLLNVNGPDPEATKLLFVLLVVIAILATIPALS